MNHKTISVLAKTIVPLIAEPVKKLRDEHGGLISRLEDVSAHSLDGITVLRDQQLVLILRIEELEKQNTLLLEQQKVTTELVSRMVGIAERVVELEQRAPVPGPQGEPGPQGQSGKDGRDGIDGKDGEPGKDGRDGIDGKDGAPGLDGTPGRDGEAGLDGKDGAPGRDGIDGKDGAQGLIGPEGQAGKDGEPGRDGRDGVPGRDGAPGINGKDGIDGKDGLGFDDMTADYDGERTVTLKWQRGDQTKEFIMLLPIPLDQGIYKSGTEYQKGDMVTFGGSSWIAQCDTTAKPETSPDWRLAVKRGRDGKDGKHGEKGDRGPPGKDGKWQ